MLEAAVSMIYVLFRFSSSSIIPRYLLKLANRNLKVLLSIGGWTYSQDGDQLSLILHNRDQFISSCRTLWLRHWQHQKSQFCFERRFLRRKLRIRWDVCMICNFDGWLYLIGAISDLDYEYPVNTAQGQGFSDLVTELRAAFDKLAAQKGDSAPYQLTAAVSANASTYRWLNIPQMHAALTYWNLMASLSS